MPVLGEGVCLGWLPDSPNREGVLSSSFDACFDDDGGSSGTGNGPVCDSPTANGGFTAFAEPPALSLPDLAGSFAALGFSTGLLGR